MASPCNQWPLDLLGIGEIREIPEMDIMKCGVNKTRKANTFMRNPFTLFMLTLLNLEQEYSSGPAKGRKSTISKVPISPNPGINDEKSRTLQGRSCLFAQV